MPRNTTTARQLAEIYEQQVGEPFPGGPANAYVHHPDKWHKKLGWNWWLDALDAQHGEPLSFGSHWTVKKVLQGPHLARVEREEYVYDDDNPKVRRFKRRGMTIYEKQKVCAICGDYGWVEVGGREPGGWRQSELYMITGWYYCDRHAEQGSEFDQTLAITFRFDAESMIQPLAQRIEKADGMPPGSYSAGKAVA